MQLGPTYHFRHVGSRRRQKRTLIRDNGTYESTGYMGGLDLHSCSSGVMRFFTSFLDAFCVYTMNGRSIQAQDSNSLTARHEDAWYHSYWFTVAVIILGVIHSFGKDSPVFRSP